MEILILISELFEHWSTKERHHISPAIMNVPGVGTGAMPIGIMGNQQPTDPQQMQEQQMIKMVRAIPFPSL